LINTRHLQGYSSHYPQAQKRIPCLNQAEPEHWIAAGIAKVARKFFERRFDCSRIGDALLHQHGRHARHVRSRHRRAFVRNIGEHVKPGGSKSCGREKERLDHVRIESLLENRPGYAESPCGSTWGGKLYPC